MLTCETLTLLWLGGANASINAPKLASICPATAHILLSAQTELSHPKSGMSRSVLLVPSRRIGYRVVSLCCQCCFDSTGFRRNAA